MATEHFFTESSEASRVKATIVSKYFMAWAKVVMATARKHGRKLGYIDLFAGPGRYEDGTRSTPLMILEQAVADPEIAEMLVTQFNDQNPEHASSLLDAIREIPGIDKLKFEPKVDNLEVDDALAKQLQESRRIPTFAFADPWGYKGLSLQLISALVKDWGCDCVFFFNYNRINMGVANDIVREHIDALFGPERGAALREKLKGLDADQRENTILEELDSALDDLGGKYVLHFRFRSEKGTRTSHHLMFVTKHIRGYEIMKSIMAKESSSGSQGVASLEHNPADNRQPLLFDLGCPLDELARMLLETFAGRTMTMKAIYESHHVGRPYIKSNYKAALSQLEKEGRVTTRPPASARRKSTFADGVFVTFPDRS